MLRAEGTGGGSGGGDGGGGGEGGVWVVGESQGTRGVGDGRER